MQAELLVRFVHGFGDAIGVENGDVARLQRHGELAVRKAGDDAQDQSIRGWEQAWRAVGVNDQRRVVPTVGVLQRSGLRIEHGVEERDEHGGRIVRLER